MGSPFRGDVGVSQDPQRAHHAGLACNLIITPRLTGRLQARRTRCGPYAGVARPAVSNPAGGTLHLRSSEALYRL